MTDINSPLPPSLPEMVGQIAALNDQQFETLWASIQTERSFDLESGVIDDLSASLGIPTMRILYTLSAMSFLYDRIEDTVESDDKRPAAIRSIVKDLGLDNDKADENDILQTRLLRLLGHNAKHDRFLKIQRLQNGFLPRLMNVNTFVDIRPDISRDRSEIRHFLPIIQMNLSLDRPLASSETATIQLTPKDVEMLRDCLDDIDKKISLLLDPLQFKNAKQILGKK